MLSDIEIAHGNVMEPLVSVFGRVGLLAGDDFDGQSHRRLREAWHRHDVSEINHHEAGSNRQGKVAHGYGESLWRPKFLWVDVSNDGVVSGLS